MTTLAMVYALIALATIFPFAWFNLQWRLADV